jgi:hypothetical protein
VDFCRVAAAAIDRYHQQMGYAMSDLWSSMLLWERHRNEAAVRGIEQFLQECRRRDDRIAFEAMRGRRGWARYGY